MTAAMIHVPYDLAMSAIWSRRRFSSTSRTKASAGSVGSAKIILVTAGGERRSASFPTPDEQKLAALRLARAAAKAKGEESGAVVVRGGTRSKKRTFTRYSAPVDEPTPRCDRRRHRPATSIRLYSHRAPIALKGVDEP